MARWIIELDPGVYLADEEGDPGRTLAVENAKVFLSHPRARNGLIAAREFRPFENARVTLAPLPPNKD